MRKPAMLRKIISAGRGAATDPEARLRAVARLGADAPELDEFARDEDPRVRVEALARIDDAARLIALRRAGVDAEGVDARLEAVAAALDPDAPDRTDAEARLRALLDATRGTAPWPRVLGALRWPEVVHPALAELDDDARVLVATRQRLLELREAAARAVTGEPALQELVRRARGHDKRLFRIARERLDGLRGAREAAAQARSAVEAAVEELERHVEAGAPALYGARLDHLKARFEGAWAALDAHAATGRTELRSRFETAAERGEARRAEFELRARADDAADAGAGPAPAPDPDTAEAAGEAGTESSPGAGAPVAGAPAGTGPAVTDPAQEPTPAEAPAASADPGARAPGPDAEPDEAAQAPLPAAVAEVLDAMEQLQARLDAEPDRVLQDRGSVDSAWRMLLARWHTETGDPEDEPPRGAGPRTLPAAPGADVDPGTGPRAGAPGPDAAQPMEAFPAPAPETVSADAEGDPPEAARIRFRRLRSAMRRRLEAADRYLAHRERIEDLAREDAGTPGPGTPDARDSREKTVRDVLKSIGWPRHAAAPPALEALRGELAALREAAEAERRARLERIESRVEEIAAELERGELGDSIAHLAEVRSLLEGVPRNTTKALRKRLNGLSARANELRDWNAFATLPKREALCEAMEALIDADVEAPARAERVKALRAEWNDLGRPGKGKAAQLNRRFNQAADKAFAPCKAYFAEQQKQREFNLQNRRTIVGQLETFIDQEDWSQADWAAVERIYRTAKNEWRRFSPVSRQAGRRLQETFNRLLQELEGRLEGQWSRTAARKEAIVERARGLLDRPVDEAIREAKQLQREWKEAGSLPRKRDQALWKAFRSACDEIFARRDEARAARDGARDEDLATARALVEGIEAEVRSGLDGEGDVPSPRRLREARDQLDGLAHLPERARRELADRLTRARQAVREHDEAEAARRLLSDAEALLDFDLALVGDPGAPAPQDLPAWAGAHLERWRADRRGDGDDLALRKLCIRVEILARVDSPADDRDLRMRYQVERLSEGMGRGVARTDPARQVREVLEAWLGTPLADPGRRRQLVSRLLTALDALPGAGSGA